MAEGDSFPFDPIEIRFDGLDTDEHRIEMASLGVSLGGLSRIFSTAAQYAATQQHIQRSDVRQVRIYATTVEHPACFQMFAIAGPLVQPPVLMPILGLAKPLYEHLIRWIFAEHKKDSSIVDPMKEVCVKALEEMGHTARHESKTQTAVMQKLVDGLLDATKQAVHPVGHTCRLMSLYPGPRDAPPITIDEIAKERIMAEVPLTVSEAQPYTVYLSEIDIQTKGCRVSFDVKGESRIRGEIVDPVLSNPGDPYTAAMNTRASLRVIAKAVLDSDGKIDRLVISDTETG